jgi:hypothetical protein
VQETTTIAARRSHCLLVLAALVALTGLAPAAPALAATDDYRPVARNNSYTVEEDAILSVGAGPGVITNDSDRNGDRLFAKPVRGPSHVTIMLNRNGSLAYDSQDDYAGPDSAAYVACEYDHPRHCSASAARIYFTVKGVNDALVTHNDYYSLFEGQSRTWAAPSVLGNDFDPEGAALYVAGHNQSRKIRVSLSPGGSLRIRAPKDTSGRYFFTYLAADEDGAKTPATVTVGVRNR